MEPPVTANGTNWQQESLFYDQLHPRMKTMAKLVNDMPERSMLDAGCSAGTLKRLLPPDYDYYGCDITDHAARFLPPTHFLQVDLNSTKDLSFFEGKGIRLIHMGGFLEYIAEPLPLLRSFHRVVGVGGRLIMSIINFDSHRYQDVAKSHHADWKFKPKLEELREALSSQGWEVEREVPFIGPIGWKTGIFRYLAKRRGVNHPWTRYHTWHFIVIARAV